MRHRKCALPDECTSQCQLSHTGLQEADAPPPGCHGRLRDDRQEPGPFITASEKNHCFSQITCACFFNPVIFQSNACD